MLGIPRGECGQLSFVFVDVTRYWIVRTCARVHIIHAKGRYSERAHAYILLAYMYAYTHKGRYRLSTLVSFRFVSSFYVSYMDHVSPTHGIADLVHGIR